MVEHMIPAVGLIVFGIILMGFLRHPAVLIIGFILFAYGAYYLTHHSLLAKHHK